MKATSVVTPSPSIPILNRDTADTSVNRPDEIDWHLVSSVRKVAWKTGTSYGFRDAWAVGMTPEYAVGVWAGNAKGNGVPGLTGARTAGPVMFGIFNLLPSGGWFEEPLSEEGITAEVCHDSGHLAGMDCTRKDTLLLPKKALRSDPCPYHKTVEGVRTFILPPSMEWYYRQHHPEYKPYIPEKKEGNSLMEFIYPEEGATITIPRQLDGSIAGVTFNLAHRTPDSVVYWHLDRLPSWLRAVVRKHPRRFQSKSVTLSLRQWR